MDVMIGEDKQAPIVTIPASCIDATKYKIGQTISYKVNGKVKKIDEEYGVTIELNEDNEDEEDIDPDEFDDMDIETQDKHLEKAFNKKSKKLEEYR